MGSILANDAVMVFGVSICVFVAVYLYAGKFIDLLERKSLGSRDEILKLLDLMFVETDRKKITITMLLLSFGLGTLVFLALLPNIIAGFIIGSMVTVAGWNVPLGIIKYLYERRSSRFVEQMVDSLTIMANGVKSGLSVTQSMERVVENLPNPVAQEFGLVLSQIRLGRSLEEALVELGERIPKPDVQMFVTAINILKETGGNLGETFTTIVLTIRERQKIEKKIEAMTAQGIMQGIIISLVPIALLLIFYMLDQTYVKPMFSTTMGLILLAVMFGLQILGGLVIRKIVTIKV